MNTNYFKAMNLICSVCVEKNLSPMDVKDLVLVVLSDMQIDAGMSIDKTMHSNVKKMFEVTHKD